MGNFLFISRDVRTKIFRTFLNREDRHVLMYALGAMRHTPVDDEFLVNIVKRNHLEVLKWVEKTYCYVCLSNNVICLAAANHGHTDILEYMVKHCNRNLDYFTLYEIVSKASKNGHVNVLSWVEKRYISFRWDKLDRYVSQAAVCGGIDTIQFITKKGCVFIEEASIVAQLLGNLDILKWLYEYNGNTLSCGGSCAAANRHIEVLKWMHSKELMNIEECLTSAKLFKQTQIVEWLESL